MLRIKDNFASIFYFAAAATFVCVYTLRVSAESFVTNDVALKRD